MTVMQTRSTMTILARLMSTVTARRNQCTPVTMRLSNGRAKCVLVLTAGRRDPLRRARHAARVSAVGAPGQRRDVARAGYGPVHVDARVERPRARASAALDLRREHLLSAAPHAGLLGEPDRQRVAGGADPVAHRQPSPRNESGGPGLVGVVRL